LPVLGITADYEQAGTEGKFGLYIFLLIGELLKKAEAGRFAETDQVPERCLE
jgi:hypothetical protein